MLGGSASDLTDCPPTLLQEAGPQRPVWCEAIAARGAAEPGLHTGDLFFKQDFCSWDGQ